MCAKKTGKASGHHSYLSWLQIPEMQRNCGPCTFAMAWTTSGLIPGNQLPKEECRLYARSTPIITPAGSKSNQDDRPAHLTEGCSHTCHHPQTNRSSMMPVGLVVEHTQTDADNTRVLSQKMYHVVSLHVWANVASRLFQHCS